jgi:hypothetical protein
MNKANRDKLKALETGAAEDQISIHERGAPGIDRVER